MKIRAILTTTAIGALPVLALCYFMPLQIYAGNSKEFLASFTSVAELYFPYAAMVVGIIGLSAFIMTPDGLRRYQATLAAIALLLWLQGNILVWDYGILDGRDIDWLADSWRGILDAVTWGLILLLAILGFRRFGKILVLAAIAVVVIQIATAVATAAGSAEALMTGPDIEADSGAADAIFSFSKSNNVLHIVMDGFQSDIFNDIVTNPENDGIREELGGFTLFANNTGVYPYTQLTIPALLSGAIYRNHKPLGQFIDGALTGHTILSVAADNGYEVDIAAPVGLKNTYSKAPHNFAYGIRSSDHVDPSDYVVNDAAKLLDLALFRSVPHFAKALVFRDELWVFQSYVRPADYLHLQYFSDLAFLDRMATEMSLDREAPVYKLLHLMLSHRPTVANKRCEFDGKRVTNRENVTQQARCGLLGVVSVLRRMRELGIYDDSLIVMMADHGAWVPVENSTSNNATQGASAMTIAMAIPVLAIKRPGSGGPLRTNHAPTSVADVPISIARILGLDSNFPGQPVFAIDVDSERKRSHLTYAYGTNPDAEDYLFTMREYEINGSAIEAGSWHRVILHPPGAVATDR